MIGMQPGDCLDALADDLLTEHPALIHEDRHITWGQYAARTNNLARALMWSSHGMTT